MTPQTTKLVKSLAGAVIGGSIGFFVGAAAIFTFGILGLIGPFIGFFFGALLGGLAMPAVSITFLLGMVVTAPIAFSHYTALAHAQIGPQWRSDIAPSPLYILGPINLAIGWSLVGGAVAGLVAALILLKKYLSHSLVSIAAMLVMGCLGVGIEKISEGVFENWVHYEAGYQSSMRQAVEAEKKRLEPGPRDLPVHEGPFLYPNRKKITGDSFMVKITTSDNEQTVAQYYKDLGATLREHEGGQEGTFPYQGKLLKVRIADQGTGETTLVLTVAGY